jgi:nucleoside-diphosphate-sugar epimerase
MQAVSLCRLDFSLRIASLRLHHCRETYEDAIPHILPGDLWSWTSFESCAESALLGLTSEGWTGAEVFIICSDETGWEGGVTYESIRKGSKPERETSVLDLIKHAYPQVKIREEYWKENKRRSVFDNSKAKEMLGWEHRDIGKA